MSSKTMSSTLVALSVGVAAIAWFRWERAAPPAVPERVGFAALREFAPAVTDSALADAEDFTVTNDPFRLSNTASAVRYDPADDGPSMGVAAPPPLRPMLVLKAIVGGPPWQAVIDGIPGQPAGIVAREGARFDRLRIRAVTRDGVIIQGPDTTWVLSFRGRS